jgi:hypothetical protein
VSTDLLSFVLGYRTGEWRRNRKMLETPEFRAFSMPLKLSYRAKSKSTAAHSDGKYAGPAIEKWNNYDCAAQFATRELAQIQLFAAIQPTFDAQGPTREGIVRAGG